MPYRISIKLADDTDILSPIICPDNPTHGYDEPAIPDKIHKFGMYLLKYKHIKSFKIISVGRERKDT